MKKLMLGNEAVARGLYEAGCTIISSYPGTPSTEITEFAATYSEIYAEWAVNEKVAMEVALGASIGGERSFCAMKHVGLNVAADPLFTASYTGINAGMVIAVADDPGMHSSQNEQDSRRYAIAAKIPMLEPSDSQECIEFIKSAYEISEKFDTPVLLRLSTRISHSQSIVKLLDRENNAHIEYKKQSDKYVMMPGLARRRRIVVDNREQDLKEFTNTCNLNKLEIGDSDIGVITSGISYQYVREALPNANILKLGIVNPLPKKLIKDFAAKVKKIYVVEELDPIIEEYCKCIGISTEGKNILPMHGEYSQKIIASAVLGREKIFKEYPENIPVRPPVMCPGCPHRGVFTVLNKLKVMVSGDIGCYTLGATPPLNAIDTTICMGASISGLHGFNLADKHTKSVAVIGDSTFMHSGITGLINITYNKGISTVIIVDNRITGMTGHQHNPTTGQTLKGETTPIVSIEKICEAVGVPDITVIDPNDMVKLEEVLSKDTDHTRVIIARRPCALLVAPKASLEIDKEKCKSCKACLKPGCPAISMKNNKAEINQALCVGCDLCKQLCAFGAISSKEVL